MASRPLKRRPGEMRAREVAAWTELSIERVRQLARSGEIPAVQRDGAWWLRRDDVERRWPNLSGKAPPQLSLVRGGPTSVSGKKVSSKNSLKHALYSRDIVIESGRLKESAEDFDELVNDVVEHLQPRTAFELRKCCDIAAVEQRRRRLRVAERVELTEVGAEYEYVSPPPQDPLAPGARRLIDALKVLDVNDIEKWRDAALAWVLSTRTHDKDALDETMTQKLSMQVMAITERWTLFTDRFPEMEAQTRGEAVAAAERWAAALSENEAKPQQRGGFHRRVVRDREQAPLLEPERQQALNAHEVHLARVAQRLLQEFQALRAMGRLGGSFSETTPSV